MKIALIKIKILQFYFTILIIEIILRILRLTVDINIFFVSQQLQMQKLTARQINKQKQTQKQISIQYQKILKHALNQNESLRIILEYCIKNYNQQTDECPIIPSFGQYSPKEICKNILQYQLKLIQLQFLKLPNQQAKLQNFILILINVLTPKFEQVSKNLIGFLGIFKQIKPLNNDKAKFQDFFKYVVGQIANLQDQQSTTEFQVHFEEQKKQDYLLHDNGIKKIYFAKDLKIYLVLDQNSEVIKLYNTEMKIISRYQPSKEKHNNRLPKIKYFDFNQFGNKLGLVYSDNTFQMINLLNYLTKDRAEFQTLYLSYLIFPTEEIFLRLQFIQMTNKWLALSETNKLYLLNPQKPKQSKQQLVRQIQPFDDSKEELKITDILQLVAISTVCIVAGNQILFFDQSFSEKKIRNYKHLSAIRLVKFCEQKNQFFILADQKYLTILTFQRNLSNMKISSYPLDYVVKDFEIFSHFETILMTDSQNNLHLNDLKSLFCYKTTPYFHIAKRQGKYVRIFKTSKFQFLVFQSYMISMIQEKVALEKQMEYNIDPDVYFNEQREEISMSVNHQILTFNVLSGQIIKICNSQRYDLSKYSNYLIDQIGQIILLDPQMNIFYLQKRSLKQKQSAAKHLEIQSLKTMKYNKIKKCVYVIGRDQVYEIKNNNKNLQVQRILIFQNLDEVFSVNYVSQKNILFIATDNFWFYLLDLENFRILRKLKLKLPKHPKMVEDTKCLECFYIFELQIAVILANSNHMFLVSTNNPNCQKVINLLEGVRYQQVDIDFKFIKLVVESLSFNQNKKTKNKSNQEKQYNTMLTTSDGHFMIINITEFLQQIAKQVEQQIKDLKAKPYKAIQTNKNKFLVNVNFVQSEDFVLDTKNSIKLTKQVSLFDKRHEKQIMIMKIIFLEKYLVLTVSKQGQIKLCQGYKNICVTRLPNLVRKQWNTEDIEKIKIIKMSKQIRTLLLNLQKYWTHQRTPKQLLSKIKFSKHKMENLGKINHDEPIPIQIQRKNIEQLVTKQMFYQRNCNSPNSLKQSSVMFKTHRKLKSYRFQQASKSFSHPWRQKKQFINIFSNAPSESLYVKKIPKDLISLRRSLDMIPKKQKINPQEAELKIIPQLNLYKFQQTLDKDKQVPQKQNKNQSMLEELFKDSKQAFQSCYYVKSVRKMRKTNINDFDQIDKQFFKKNISFGKKYISKKQDQKEQSSYSQNKVGKAFIQKNNRKQQANLNYNIPLFKANPISSVLELFQKHNKEVIGSKYGRQINIGKAIKQLKNKDFSSRQ